MRGRPGEQMQLSLKLRVILIAIGLVLLLAGLVVADISLAAGIVLMALGVLVAFIGTGKGGGGADLAFRRGGVKDPRKSETRMYRAVAPENPWETMGKGKK